MKRFPYVVGTDLVDIRRWNIAETPIRISKLAQKVLHYSERNTNTNAKAIARQFLALTSKHHDDVAFNVEKASPELRKLLDSPVDRSQVSTFFAGRWAAKEAAKKAWGADLLGFRDVQVLFDKSADPPLQVRCLPRTLLDKDGKFDTEHFQYGSLSISHDGDYVTATVIAEPLRPELRAWLVQRQDYRDERMKSKGASGETTQTPDTENDSSGNPRIRKSK